MAGGARVVVQFHWLMRLRSMGEVVTEPRAVATGCSTQPPLLIENPCDLCLNTPDECSIRSLPLAVLQPQRFHANGLPGSRAAPKTAPLPGTRTSCPPAGEARSGSRLRHLFGGCSRCALRRTGCPRSDVTPFPAIFSRPSHARLFADGHHQDSFWR